MPYTRLQLADAFIQTGELQDALDALNQHLDVDSGDDAARRLRAQVLMRLLGEPNQRAALADFQALTDATSQDAINQYEVLTRLGDADGAFQVLEGAWHREHTDRLAEVFVQCLLARGNGEYALHVSGTMPPIWRWLSWSGDAAAVIGDDNLALDYYTRALEDLKQRLSGAENAFTASIEAGILLKRGTLYQRGGQFSKADADYLAAQSIIPTDAMIAFKRGLLSGLLGDSAQAEQLCHAAWIEANDVLRDEMRLALAEDERFAALTARLNP